jgi:SAM-dependent methyltransferase
VIGAKVALSRLRLPYSVWRKFGLFRLGKMDSTGYALRSFSLHKQRAFGGAPLTGKTILEIGPGDSLASAVIGKALGAQSVVLVDAGAYATGDVGIYRKLAKELAAEGLDAPDLHSAKTVADVLDLCGGRYLTSGVDSFGELAANSVDFVWSHSVLEHIPKGELPRLFRELRRVLRNDGAMSHNIDFQDHLSHSLNSLRFSERLWESPLFKNAGFYTNRVRAAEMHAMIRNAGFDLVIESHAKWKALPMSRRRMHAAFSKLDEQDLLVHSSHLLAKPNGSTVGRDI